MNNNKGFTKIELICVISFFALVLAIVIPSLISLNKKVKFSEDLALVTLLNETLEESLANTNIETLDQLVIILEEKGYSFNDLYANNEGCHFVWESETNQILLVKEKGSKYKVLYNSKKGYGKCDDSWHFAA